MKRVIIPIENYELDDYKVHKDGMKDYAYLILLISRKLISFPHLSEENINSISKPFLMMDICKNFYATISGKGIRASIEGK
ncbi:MAG: hypothetical protein HUK10_07840 [Bacteroides heparinolyticus]|nr:hypothetical protein [Bacteroides heparinolyticus]